MALIFPDTSTKKGSHRKFPFRVGKAWIGYFLYVIFLGSIFLVHINLSAQPNHYEEILIKESVLDEFTTLINTWKEELYFEMYDFGSTESKSVLSLVEFAQRMVDLRWKPSLVPLKNVDIQIVYRNYATIRFVQQYENKINMTDIVTKEMVFPATMEGNQWKFDLTQLINIPYEGKLYKEPEKKKDEGETKPKPAGDATSDAAEQN